MKRAATILAIAFFLTACAAPHTIATNAPLPPGSSGDGTPNINRSQIDVFVGGYTVHSSCDGQGHRVYRLGDAIAVSPDDKCGAQ